MRRAMEMSAGWLALVLIAVVPVAASDVRLVEAAKKPSIQSVRSLIAQHLDPNVADVDGTTALHWAAHWDDVAMTELLLRAGAKTNVTNRYGYTPLYLAAQNGGAAIIERLLKAGADPNLPLPEGQTPLMTAARTGKLDAVNLLLSHDAHVN